VKIHLPTYPIGIHEITEDLNPADLDLSPAEFSHTVHVSIRLDRHDPYFDFRIKLSTVAAAECDRCLNETSVEIRTENPLLYVVGHAPEGDLVDDDDFSYIKPGTIELDLTQDLRDFLILAYSGRHLCSEECQGLCVNCGADLNTGSCICTQG